MSTKVWKGIVENIREGQKKAEIPISEAKGLMSGNLREALEELAEISAGLNLVEMVTPVNATEEKEKWLELARKGLFTDPVFQYNTDLLETVRARKTRLQNLEGDFLRRSESLKYEQPKSRTINSIALSRFQETEMIIRSAEVILGQDVPYLNMVMGTIFPEVQSELLEVANTEAKRLINPSEEATGKRDFALLSKADRLKLQEMKLDAEEIRNYFWIVAKQYGIEMTRPIEVSTSATSIDVRDKSSVGPIVVVPHTREVSGLKLLELIAHEVEGHWRASENAQAILPLIGGGALKPNDETFYEGHAMLLEHRAKFMLKGVKDEMAKPWYILAINFAKSGCSFSDTAVKLFPQIRTTTKDDDIAYKQVWGICMRVYRGLSNTHDNSKKYAFTKDQAYFSGRMLAEDLFDAGLEHLLEFSTLSIRDLETLSQVFKIKPTDVKYRRRVDVLTNIAGMLLAHCD